MFGQSTTKSTKTKQQKQTRLVSRNNAGSYWITWRWSQQSISNISTWFPEGFQTGRTPISGTERGNLQFVCWPKASSEDISRWFLITVLWQKGTISEVQAKDSLAEYVLQLGSWLVDSLMCQLDVSVMSSAWCCRHISAGGDFMSSFRCCTFLILSKPVLGFLEIFFPLKLI